MTRLLVVTTMDGMVFTGADSKEIVRQMKNTDWSAPEQKKNYITEVIRRVYSMTDVAPSQPVTGPSRAMKFLRYLREANVARYEWVDEGDDE